MEIKIVSPEFIGRVEGFTEVAPGVWHNTETGVTFITAQSNAVLITPKE